MQTVIETNKKRTFSNLPALPQGKTKEEKEALLKKLQAFKITDFPLQDALEALNEL